MGLALVLGAWSVGAAAATAIGFVSLLNPLNISLCLETLKFPNAINGPAWQDEVILRHGQPYRHVMVHTFCAEP